MARINDQGESNVVEIHENARVDSNVRIEFYGSNNVVKVDRGTYLRNPNVIRIEGNNNKFTVSSKCNIRGAFHIRQNGSSVDIGSGTTAVGLHVFAMEGRSVRIGADCMFSSSIFVRTSDEHSIYDLDTNERINKAKDVVIGDRVWVCEGVTIAKGVSIPDGCIIGVRSYVSKTLTRPQSIYVGSPAKLIRERVYWDRRLRPEDM